MPRQPATVRPHFTGPLVRAFFTIRQAPPGSGVAAGAILDEAGNPVEDEAGGDIQDESG